MESTTYRAGTDVPHLATFDHIFQCFHDLLSRRIPVQSMDLQHVDVGTQSLFTLLSTASKICFLDNPTSFTMSPSIFMTAEIGGCLATGLDTEVASRQITTFGRGMSYFLSAFPTISSDRPLE